MAESLRGGLSLCLSGFGFWSHDIGGFEQTPSADLYKRWCAFGLLSSHSRLHGSGSYRVPWLFDEEAVEVLRFFTKLKCRLMPYLFDAACEARDTGVDYLDRQYVLGSSLLVAPVFSPDGAVDYYLPEGRWTNFITGRVVEGPRWVHETHGYLSLPLMVRPNAVIPVGANEQRPDYDYDDGVTFHVFEIRDGETISARVPTIRGEVAMRVTLSRSGPRIRIQVEGTSGRWSVLLRGIGSVQSIDGGIAKADPLGTRIVPADGVRCLTLCLPESGHK